MAYGDIHNKTGTICKARSDATCPLSADGGHSRDTDEYIDTVSARDGLNADRIRAIMRDGNSAREAVSIVSEGLDGELFGSKSADSGRSNPHLRNFQRTEEPLDLDTVRPGDRYYDGTGKVYVAIAVERSQSVGLAALKADGTAPLDSYGRPAAELVLDRNSAQKSPLRLARPLSKGRSAGGPAASKAIRDLPSKGRLSRAVIGLMSYTDESGRSRDIELVASGRRFTEKKRLNFGRALWEAGGYDVAEYDSRSKADRLSWTNLRIEEQSNFSWQTEPSGRIISGDTERFGSEGHRRGSTYRHAELKAVDL